MISPTGKGVRSDSWGDGHYGAPRGDRTHKGTDYICIPGQPVYSPITGTALRVAKPYDGPYSGIMIQGKHVAVKLFYLLPTFDLIGKPVKQGQPLGIAQDISLKYSPDMIPHIHLEIDSLDPEIFVRML